MSRKRGVLPALALAIAALAVAVHPLMQGLENRLLDSFVKSQASRLAPDPDIVLVDIDEKSLEKMEKEAGRWPWSRAVYISLIEGLAAQKARAIVFDMLSSRRTRTGRRTTRPLEKRPNSIPPPISRSSAAQPKMTLRTACRWPSLPPCLACCVPSEPIPRRAPP
jgi:CHASE2 domain-containing sensor protein